MNNLKDNFISWTSGNEKIDNLIQKEQLNYKFVSKVFKWIPYNKFINIKEIGDNCLTTAIWKKGPLHYTNDEWIRISNEEVVLRFLYDSQNITDEFIIKV